MTQRVSGSYHCVGIGVLSVGGGEGDRVGSLAGGMTASAGSGGGDPRSDLPGGRESWRLCALDDLRDVPRDPCRAERLAAASFAAAILGMLIRAICMTSLMVRSLTMLFCGGCTGMNVRSN